VGKEKEKRGKTSDVSPPKGGKLWAPPPLARKGGRKKEREGGKGAPTLTAGGVAERRINRVTALPFLEVKGEMRKGRGERRRSPTLVSSWGNGERPLLTRAGKRGERGKEEEPALALYSNQGR